MVIKLRADLCRTASSVNTQFDLNGLKWNPISSWICTLNPSNLGNSESGHISMFKLGNRSQRVRDL